jgi:hypothetical protein
MFVLHPIFDMGADIADRRFVPLSDIGEGLKEENFFSLKEGQAKILGLLLPPPAEYATPRSLFGGAMGMLGYAGRAAENSSPPVSS